MQSLIALVTSIAFVRPNAACLGIAPLKPRAKA